MRTMGPPGRGGDANGLPIEGSSWDLFCVGGCWGGDVHFGTDGCCRFDGGGLIDGGFVVPK